MISYFGGPEGAGKTALMTRFCRMHHLAGGEVWAFPGYEHKNQVGRVISRLVLPEQVMGLLDDMQYVVLTIDEIQNFMQHHKWYNNLVDIMAYGAAAQRRKREFVILATGPIFDWVPKDLRLMFHVVFECRDRHWREKYIPRGQQIMFTMEDKRGVLSGYPGMKTREKRFWPKKYFPYYDTFSLVDPKYQFLKMNIQRDEVFLDSGGNLIGANPSASLSQYADEFKRRTSVNPNKEAVFQFVTNRFKEMIEQGMDRFNLNHLMDEVKDELGYEIPNSTFTRNFLNPLKCERISPRAGGYEPIYALPELSSTSTTI